MILYCYTEHPQSGSSALSVINGPTAIAPDLAIFCLFVCWNCNSVGRNCDFESEY